MAAAAKVNEGGSVIPTEREGQKSNILKTTISFKVLAHEYL